jgi:peptidoglycan/xylan/chitin deacetylase (PgdA/CDA1 family)
MSRLMSVRRIVIAVAVLFVLAVVSLPVFFDQAILVRKDTLFHIDTNEKIVALTFDDGPSERWTPRILDELKKAGVKATFFMIGEHVEKYPDIVQRVHNEGHEIGNHTYDHHGIFYYTPEELTNEIERTDDAIERVIGERTKYFRPPKAWITDNEKRLLKEMGYTPVLWTLNSKDWVTFDDKYIVPYIVKRTRPGDILLFHDSGGVFGIDDGDRGETVKSIPQVISELRRRGYRFVTISELLSESDPLEGNVSAR